jgi:hypothetical protein
MSEGIEWLKGQLEKEAERMSTIFQQTFISNQVILQCHYIIKLHIRNIFCSQDDSALQDDDIEYLCSQNTLP